MDNENNQRSMDEEVAINNGAFRKTFKKYDETKSYHNYAEHEIYFDPTCLELDSVTDILEIMSELNNISLKIFTYGSFCDSQARVLQYLEDSFERWKADKLHNAGIDDRAYRSEKSKERFLMVTFKEEYRSFQNSIAMEQYKLSLLQRVTKALESYGYKLHALKDYNLAIERNS